MSLDFSQASTEPDAEQPICGRHNLGAVSKRYNVCFSGPQQANRRKHLDSAKRVAVIGAGPAGLAAAKCLREAGHSVQGFERSSGIGGIWNSGADSSRVYANTLMTSSKFVTSFSDFPPDPELPHFLSHQQYLEYLQSYARKFSIEHDFRFSTTVTGVKRSLQGWTIETVSHDGLRAETFDAVAVCSGLHQQVAKTGLEGLEDFEGGKIHSSEYFEPSLFRDKNVAIVGAGESASAIASEVSNVSARAYLVVKRGTWVLPRYSLKGFPQDFFTSRARFSMPRCIYSAIEPLMFRVIWASSHRWASAVKSVEYWSWHSKLARLSGRTFHAGYITKCDDAVVAFSEGRLQLAQVARFTKHGAKFDNGQPVELDAVILCTGYEPVFPFLDVPIEIGALQLHVFHPELPGIAFIGFARPNLGAIPPLAELQSRLFASVLRKQVNCQNMPVWSQVDNSYSLANERLPYLVEWVPYARAVAKLAECEPNLLRLSASNPLLAFKVLFGPFTVHQFRIHGDGAKCETAKKVLYDLPIMTATLLIVGPLFAATLIPFMLYRAMVRAISAVGLIRPPERSSNRVTVDG